MGIDENKAVVGDKLILVEGVVPELVIRPGYQQFLRQMVCSRTLTRRWVFSWHDLRFCFRIAWFNVCFRIAWLSVMIELERISLKIQANVCPKTTHGNWEIKTKQEKLLLYNVNSEMFKAEYAYKSLRWWFLLLFFIVPLPMLKSGLVLLVSTFYILKLI